MEENKNQAGQVPAEEMMVQWEFSHKVRHWVQEASEKRGRPLKALVKTFGCQGNVADGEKLLGMLCEMGYIPTDSLDEADLILYNTCAIRENAESKLLSSVGELKHKKEKNPQLIIGLCGCMMQQEQVTARIKQSYHYVDLVFGTHVMHTLPQLVHQVLSDRKRVIDIRDSVPQFAEGLPVLREKGVMASIQIMYGCDNFCSYCIVPYVRGREVSRKPDAILQEARQVIAEGYKEILLLGQNVNSYGKGLPEDEKISFAQLLEKINDLDGEFRIRFMTSHPKDCTRDLIDTIARCKKVCRCIHLPVQSGSNRVLKEMNRKYSKEQYLELVRYAKEKIPDIAFSSDIIVGFPGETYEEFQETLQLVQEVRYQLLYTFIYSPRPGTRAAKMDDPVPAKEKSRWMGELLETVHTISDEINASYLGKTVVVLAEKAEPDPEQPDKILVTGRCDQNILVRFPGDASLVGTFVPVRITKSFRSALAGEMVTA